MSNQIQVLYRSSDRLDVGFDVTASAAVVRWDSVRATYQMPNSSDYR